MFAELMLSLTFAGARVHAEKGPWMGRVPACDRYLGNVRNYLHDPAGNAPVDNYMQRKDGVVTEDGMLANPDAMIRALVPGSFVQAEVGGHAKVVRPQRRGILRVDGFWTRIPRRDRREIRALGERGIVTTADEHFPAVLEMCAAVERHDHDRVTGRRLLDTRGRPVPEKTWISDDMKTHFKRLHVHPERFVRSRAAWLPRADGSRRLIGGLVWQLVAGVPTGETMCMDRTVASGIGKLLLHDLLVELHADGHPWLDVQEVQPNRLLARWGAEEVARDQHEAAVRARHEEYVSADRSVRTP